MIWHLYDYYLMPGGGYFGTKKACEPVHVQYSYDDKSVVVVNTTFEPLQDMKLTAKVYDISFAEKLSRVLSVDLQADSNLKAFVLPPIPDLSSAYFLRLALEDRRGQTVSSNFYWLSTKDDVLDPQKSKWYYTPVSSFADMTQLQQLPPVRPSVSGSSVRRAGVEVANITVSNPSRTLAFFIRLQIKQGHEGRDVLPIIWQDNYFSLAPGERKQITATYELRDLGKAIPFLAVEGWNVPSVVVPITIIKKQARRG